MSAEQTPIESPQENGFRYTKISLDADGTPGVLVELPDGTHMTLSMPHAKRVYGAELEPLD